MTATRPDILHTCPVPSRVKYGFLALLLALTLPGGRNLLAAEHRAHRKLDSDLNERIHRAAAYNDDTPVRAIVKLRNGDAAATRALVESLGGQDTDSLNEHGVVAWLKPAALEALAANALVESVSSDADVAAFDDITNAATGAALARSTFGLSGAGVTVAVIDSGVSPHPDLARRDRQVPWGGTERVHSRIVKFVDLVNRHKKPYDDYGHGTHVAGIIGGSGKDSPKHSFAGTAPQVDFVVIKVLDKTGLGRASDVIKAIDWVIAHRVEYNIQAINLSLGHPVYESMRTDPLVRAVEEAVHAGLVVVVAAGNFGRNPETGVVAYGGITSPGNAPSAITVGATKTMGTPARSDDAVADFSSRGPTRFDFLAKPDVVAPGNRIVSLRSPGSTLATQFPGQAVPGNTPWSPGYFTLSGTSMAAPVVTGTIALLLQANPGLHPNAVKAVVQYTAEQLPGYDALTQGAGYLNALGAVRLARSISPSASLSDLWISPLPTPTDMIAGEPITWGENIVWGDRLLRGNGIQIHAAAWDDNIVWGNVAVWDGDNIVWGNSLADNVVWGNSIVWGSDDNIVWGAMTPPANPVWSANVVWGSNVVWGNNVVWGSTIWANNVVWGNFVGHNIVWGDLSGDNVVWGASAVLVQGEN